MDKKLKILFYVQLIAYFIVCLLDEAFKINNPLLTKVIFSVCLIDLAYLIYGYKGTNNIHRQVKNLILIFVLINETFCKFIQNMNCYVIIIYLCIAFIIYLLKFNSIKQK